jgi:hypothetical protein
MFTGEVGSYSHRRRLDLDASASRGKHSSLLGIFVIFSRKMFYTINSLSNNCGQGQEPFRRFLLGLAPCFTHEHWTKKSLARTGTVAYLAAASVTTEQRICDAENRCQCYKAFFLRRWRRCQIRTNTQACKASSSATTEKSFKTLAPGVDAIKLFLFVADDEAK